MIAMRSVDDNRPLHPNRREAVIRKSKKGQRRNIGPMLASPRCGARTRSGSSCRSPAVTGKRRCRMHGGAEGTGAPKGNRNAWKHGEYTKEALEMRRKLAAMVRASLETLLEFSSY